MARVAADQMKVAGVGALAAVHAGLELECRAAAGLRDEFARRPACIGRLGRIEQRAGGFHHVPDGGPGFLRFLPRPCSTALTAASTRERMPSLRRIALTCSLTVPSVICSVRAIILLLEPS